jgi:nitrate/TMAO reductase-like tetraheme cytochrome c subunit
MGRRESLGARPKRAAGTLAAALALLSAAALAPGNQGEDERAVHERIDLPSIAACGSCHQRVYEEWSRTLHARAWTNENVRQATRNFEIERCRACHSPQPVLETGLDREPDFRDFNREDGVHCLSCHGLADGVAARRTIQGAPCRPRETPALLMADMCFPCHQPTHGAFDEYRTSSAFRDGVRCADCHMPERADGGYSHGPNGGFNPEFVKRALFWSASVEDGELRVELENRCGHKFPGEIPSRSFHVHVAFDVGEPRTVLLRKPHKGEKREDDRLLPDETRTLRFPVPEGAASAEVRLLFRPLPLLPESQAFVLGEWRWN